MTHFKKWLREDSKKTGFLYDEEAERQRRKGWRGALKFVLKHCLLGKAGFALIKKELQDESD